MAWRSTTFTRSGEPASEEVMQKLAGLAERHRPAMERVILQAREYAADRERLLSGIRANRQEGKASAR